MELAAQAQASVRAFRCVNALARFQSGSSGKLSDTRLDQNVIVPVTSGVSAFREKSFSAGIHSRIATDPFLLHPCKRGPHYAVEGKRMKPTLENDKMLI